ncbi:hypothetical protein TNCV_581731 [Trichonephila clavipes]|nr:hypothetical protein TNCV_581731 [Trichonephila clavipes]
MCLTKRLFRRKSHARQQSDLEDDEKLMNVVCHVSQCPDETLTFDLILIIFRIPKQYEGGWDGPRDFELWSNEENDT